MSTRHIRSILDAGRAALRAQASIEETLWEVWNATGLDARLQAAALRGGATGSQADRDLDAMMSLFDAGQEPEADRDNGIGLFVTDYFGQHH